MATLTAREIAIVAYATGGLRTVASIGTAVAIALAESGGNPLAHNKKRPDNSYGLWQINMIDNLGPARREQFGLDSNDQLFRPTTNARAMKVVSGGGSNWQPWTTYTSGKHRMFLSRGQDAARWVLKLSAKEILGKVSQVDKKGKGSVPSSVEEDKGIDVGDIIPDPLEGLVAPVTTIAGLLTDWVELQAKAAAWIADRDNWSRIIQVVGGVGLVFVGVSIFARPYVEERIQQATEVAT